MSRPVYLAGSGSYLPGAPIPHSEIAGVLGDIVGAPERIRRWSEQASRLMQELLDIDFVHYAFDPTSREVTDDNVTMSVKAARPALEMAGLAAEQIDLLCYGSAHQDQMPTASVRIQEALGIERCEELAIHANCTSAYKALYLAHQLVAHGRNDHALVLSASMSSSELRAEYYNPDQLDKESLFLRWFLSDGAGAVVLTSDPARSVGLELEATYIESVGGKRPSLMYNERPAYWLNPREEYERGLHHLRQRFRNALSSGVFREADGGSVFFNGLKRMLEREHVPVERVRVFQVNMPTKHIIDSIMDECEGIGIPRQALFTRLDRLGYCGPPMVLIGLDEVVRHVALEPGDRVLSFVTEVSKFMQAGYAMRYAGQR
jgi:3-oxoacyl-[acyl-carrier-protein] synthase-3